jgi:hypothetical protein
MTEDNTDLELQAIQQVLKALESLDSDARARVIDYIFKRLGLKVPPATTPIPPSSFASGASELAPSAAPLLPPVGGVVDIRALKESKAPRSDNEMAALMAFYLKHHAPEGEKKESVSTADVEKYFIQANYPLPKQPRFTLQNAKNAGYFDPAERGFFKLNPVGYNLVVHGLSESHTDRAKSASRSRARPAKKTARKGK